MRLRSLLSRLPRGLAAGFCCALLVALLSSTNLLQNLENSTLDLMFWARGARSPDPRIAIVVADDATVARAGNWPLPRSLHAKVISRLTKAGARTIALDILFSTQSFSTKEDATLVKACRDSGKVIQASALHVPLLYNPTVAVTSVGDRRPLPQRFTCANEGATCREAAWASSALPALLESAPAVGHINIHPELDGALRRLPLLIRNRDRLYPSLSLAAAAHFLGIEPNAVVGRPNEVVLPEAEKKTVVPIDNDGETWINWAGGNGTFPTYNFNQLLDGHVPEEALKDRIVLVGVTAAGAFEYRATPFSPAQPAIELQANAISDILLNQPLRQMSPIPHLLLVLVVGLFTGAVVAPRRAIGATACLLGILGGLWFIGVFELNANLYIPLLTPVLASVLTYSAVTALNYRKEWESNWRADVAVSALARGGALMAYGRERESLTEVITRTALEVLDAQDIFLVLMDPVDGSLMFPKADSRAALAPAVSKVLEDGKPLIWLASSPQASPQLFELAKDLTAQHRLKKDVKHPVITSIVAAPLAVSPYSQDSLSEPRQVGVLLATGRKNGEAFTERDLVLLQTLTEQAGLAFDNLGYYEILQGRVELANRNLRQAYDVLSNERAELSQERTKLAAAVGSMESALIIADENHVVAFENGLISKILGEEAVIIGLNMPEVLKKMGWPGLSMLYEEIETNPDHKATVETTRTVEREENFPPERLVLQGQLTPLLAPGNARLGSMLVVADVTADRELEQMKSDFVSFVAHELRTPLTSINGFAALMKLDSLNFSREEREDMLDSIEGQCTRLNRMISDLLEVARLEPGHGIQLRLQEMDLALLARKVVNQLQILIQNPDKLTLQIRAQVDHLWIQADPDRMEQILVNLISNAIKYSPDGGVVTLELKPAPHDHVVLAVSDTGMGMTQEQVVNLFQKFFRTSEAQARGIKGTGLGLYLVKQMVEAHRGTIEVESVAGQGTSFIVTLPDTLEVEL